MNIFIVCNYLGGGGAERVAVRLAEGLVQRGENISLIADLERYRSYVVNKNINLLPLHQQNISKSKKIKQAILNIRKYAKENKPDIIIGFMHFCSLVSRIAVVGLNIPVISTVHHALESDTYKIDKIVKLLDKYSLPIYQHVTVLTKPDLAYLGNKIKNVSVMPNPLSFEPYEGELEKETFILAAGRINDWHYKGWDVLIKTWAHIANKYPQWSVKIAGNGDEETFHFLKKIACNYKISDRIDFLGYRTDMLELYKRASIFLLSSRSEGLPMVLIEAMSQGCACVATDYKGRTKEIITNEKEGLLAEPEDDIQLAKHLQTLIEDEQLRLAIQKNSIKRSYYYQLNHIIDMWEDLLNQIKNKK